PRRAGNRLLPGTQDLRARPPGARPPLRHRRLAGPRRARLGAAARLRRGLARHRALVSRQPRLVRGGAGGHVRPRAPRAGSRAGERGLPAVRFLPRELPEVILVEPEVHGDDRGFFLETYHQRKFADGGVTAAFVQDNHSYSVRGILRGLHAQIKKPQGKLVRTVVGEIFDVAVDIRPDSPTFGKGVSEILSGENLRQLWVPPGFAHGFCVLSETAHVLYKC